MKKLTFVSIIFLLFIYSNTVHSLTCTAIASGSWESSSTWSCGISPPSCGATIVIPSGFTVTINSTEDYPGGGCAVTMRIDISGRLAFANGKKLTLPTNSELYIYSGGSIVSGGGGGSSNLITIGATNWWKAGDGNVSGPSSFPTGLLPIELTYFKAKSIDKKNVQLNWQTATELNNQFFTVERSMDGLNFESINTLSGAGNSNSMKNYEWIDQNAGLGVNYYRLKQTDFDGKFAYSGIEFIEQSGLNLTLSVHPNPSDGDVTVVIPEGISTNNKGLLLKVTDVAGKTIMESKLEYSNHQMNVSLILSKGFYYISVESSGLKLTRSTVVH